MSNILDMMDNIPEIENDDDNRIIVFDDPSYDTAFIGVSVDGRAIYDFDLMVEYLVEKDGITEEEAFEYIEYNAVRSCMYYPNAPIIINRMTLEELEAVNES